MDAALKGLSEFQATHPDAYRAAFAVAILVIVLIVDIVLRAVLGGLHKRLAPKHPLLSVITLGLRPPVEIATWLLGLWAIVALVIFRMSSELEAHTPALTRVVETGLVVLIAWMCLRSTRHAKAHAIKKHTRTDGGYDDFSAIEATSVGVQIVIVVVAFVFLLFALGIPLKALAGVGLVGGFGAYALTMANQILISNIFAGFALYLDRPFAVGDWISTKNGAVDGTVTKIGLRLTTIVGFDQRPIYVPNSIFNSNATVNPSRMSNRRICQFIGLRYDDRHRVEKIFADIRTYLKNNPEIDQNRTTLVNLVDGATDTGSSSEGAFGSYSINFNVYTFTKTTNWVEFQNIQDRVMFDIAQIIDDNGAQIAFSTTTLDVPKAITIQERRTC